jgi:hypothetical protein
MSVGIAENIEELRTAGRYISLRKTLFPGAVGSIVFGGLALSVGAPAFAEDMVSTLLALLGAFLVIEGNLVLVLGSPKLLIVEGIAILLVGATNIFITVSHLMAGSDSGFDIGFFVLGLIQLGAAASTMRRYRRYKNLGPKPPTEVVNRVAAMVKNLRSARTQTDESIVEFREEVKELRFRWKGKLLDKASMFMKCQGPDRDILFLVQEDVGMKKLKGEPEKGLVRGLFQLGSRQMYGRISPECYDRFERWKLAASQGLHEIRDE